MHLRDNSPHGILKLERVQLLGGEANKNGFDGVQSGFPSLGDPANPPESHSWTLVRTHEAWQSRHPWAQRQQQWPAAAVGGRGERDTLGGGVISRAADSLRPSPAQTRRAHAHARTHTTYSTQHTRACTCKQVSCVVCHCCTITNANRTMKKMQMSRMEMQMVYPGHFWFHGSGFCGLLCFLVTKEPDLILLCILCKGVLCVTVLRVNQRHKCSQDL